MTKRVGQSQPSTPAVPLLFMDYQEDSTSADNVAAAESVCSQRNTTVSISATQRDIAHFRRGKRRRVEAKEERAEEGAVKKSYPVALKYLR